MLLAAIWLGAVGRQPAGAADLAPDRRGRTGVGRRSQGPGRGRHDDDEIATLGLAFNRMTAQLHAQRNELVEANHQIDARRRFTEAVLAGVIAGVIGLDTDGHITIVNRAAARLLNAAPEEMVVAPLQRDGAGTGGADPPRAAGTGGPGERRSRWSSAAARSRTLSVQVASERPRTMPASSSPSTTSPIWSPPSAPPPGPMSPAASRTRSRIR